MLRWWWLLLAFQPGIVMAQDTAQGELVGDWLIKPLADGEGCTMITLYGDDTSLYASYTPRTQNVVFGFSNLKATSLADQQKVKLSLFFTKRKGTAYESGWDLTDYTVAVADDGTRRFLKLYDDDLLDDLAKWDVVGVYTASDVLVDTFPLAGSAKAVDALRNCAFADAGLNRDDPFLK